jgi:4-hydroxy-4-methyl-2-oxoglutarate aldolase
VESQDSDTTRLRALTVTVVADVLDRLGRRQQVLDHHVRPLVADGPLVGRAFPVAAVASDEVLENPYEHELAAVDAVPAGAVVVVATDGFREAAVWGELLATRALARGATGAVSDGAVRDLAGLRGLGLPTFAAAVCARDSMGRLLVTGFGEEVVCGGVRIAPGDLVLGDDDGVVVVSTDVAALALAGAEEKLALEEITRTALADGETVGAVYRRHGVL